MILSPIMDSTILLYDFSDFDLIKCLEFPAIFLLLSLSLSLGSNLRLLLFRRHARGRRG